jgi:hypothetical protein
MNDAPNGLLLADQIVIAAIVAAILIALLAVMYVRHRNALAAEDDPDATREQARHAALEILGAVAAGGAVLMFVLLGWSWWLLGAAAVLFVGLWLLSFLGFPGLGAWLQSLQLLRVIIPVVAMLIGYAEEHLSSGLDASHPKVAAVSAADLRDYGVEYAQGLLKTVDDLDPYERARIANRIEKDLGDLSGAETPAAVRERVRQVLAGEELGIASAR